MAIVQGAASGAIFKESWAGLLGGRPGRGRRGTRPPRYNTPTLRPCYGQSVKI